jgi:hypothetical protein
MVLVRGMCVFAARHRLVAVLKISLSSLSGKNKLMSMMLNEKKKWPHGNSVLQRASVPTLLTSEILEDLCSIAIQAAKSEKQS